jgi:hypothetical protein
MKKINVVATLAFVLAFLPMSERVSHAQFTKILATGDPVTGGSFFNGLTPVLKGDRIAYVSQMGFGDQELFSGTISEGVYTRVLSEGDVVDGFGTASAFVGQPQLLEDTVRILANRPGGFGYVASDVATGVAYPVVQTDFDRFILVTALNTSVNGGIAFIGTDRNEGSGLHFASIDGTIQQPILVDDVPYPGTTTNQSISNVRMSLSAGDGDRVATIVEGRLPNNPNIDVRGIFVTGLNGGTERIVEELDSIPNTNFRVEEVLTPPAMHGDDVLFLSSLGQGRTGIVGSLDGTLTVIVDDETPIPGLAGDTLDLSSFEHQDLGVENGVVVFQSRTSNGNTGVFKFSDAGLETIAMTGDTIDGRVVSSLSFTSPAFNDGRILLAINNGTGLYLTAIPEPRRFASIWLFVLWCVLRRRAIQGEAKIGSSCVAGR